MKTKPSQHMLESQKRDLKFAKRCYFYRFFNLDEEKPTVEEINSYFDNTPAEEIKKAIDFEIKLREREIFELRSFRGEIKNPN